MTRETKIGLLVGLAFLLVVGILLSEHITGATERPAAPLADAGHGVRTGVSAPGSPADEPVIAAPTGPIPTAEDRTPKPAVTQVTVLTPAAPGDAPAQQITVQDGTPANGVGAPAGGTTTTTTISQASGPVKVVAPAGGVVVTTDPFANDPIARAARDHGEAIVPADDRRALDTTRPAGLLTNTGAREYKAQAGDTLSRLAALLPGGNVKANRDAIVKVNPTLQKDPNRVVSGRAYLLPSAPPAAETPVVTVTVQKALPVPAEKVPGPSAEKTVRLVKAAPPPGPTIAAPAPATHVAADLQRTYVVKPGDTLSRIASAELGSKSELPALRTLNADVLRGTDVIKVDMKLKLPAKVMGSVR